MRPELSDREAGSIDDKGISLLLDRECMFFNHKNVYSKTMEKRQRKLLKKITEVKHFLMEGEVIRFVSTGCSPASILEQVLGGALFLYLKRSLFVFTDRRIFHIPTHKDFSYRNSIAQILYADCKSIQIKGSRLVVEYRSGQREIFLAIPSYARKKIKAMIPSVSFDGHLSLKQQRTHLCPRCTGELQEDKYVCPGCHLEFKDKERAKRLSIIYPGGGYFYTGHPFLGIGDVIVETIFLILVATSTIGVARGVPGSTINLLIFAACLTFEKLITIYHANRFVGEYIPKDRDIVPIG